MQGFDFTAGPPDVTGLPGKERLEVLRAYRHFKERTVEYDFSAGPPDVSHLEGAERLSVLRQYRHHLQSKDGAFGVGPGGIEQTWSVAPAGAIATRKDDAPTPRPPTAPQLGVPAPWLPAPDADGMPPPPPPDPSLHLPLERLAFGEPTSAASPPAGMKSGGYNSVYNYFERPLTARAERTDVPPPEGCEAEPPSPRAQVLRDDAMRAEAAEGAAGVATCRGMAGKSAWLGHWLDQESPRNCRRLAPKENGVTERRIFAPESAPDETLALTTKQLKEQQLLERQRQQEQGYQVCVCVCVCKPTRVESLAITRRA